MKKNISIFFILTFALQLFIPFVLKAIESPPYTIIEDKAKLSLLAPDLAGRKTLKIRLPNGLEAFLVSDPRSDKSGAVMSVKVGSWEDPDAYPGLAHFLEHMLFLGTKQYPEEAEYSRYITEHGGMSNAFTTDYYTTFMFDIDNDAFKEALNRFSSFFKEPLFNTSGVSRELNAIDQEYAKNLENDDWRMLQVDKELAQPEHPYHRFQIGNSNTLAKVSRDTLEEWYREHYSANLMRLMVVSTLPMDQLLNLVVSDFQEVPSNFRSPYENEKSVFSQDLNQKMVYVEPVKNTRTLNLIWEVPHNIVKMKDVQAVALVCDVLGDEGEESLLAELKREELAEALNCGQNKLGPNGTEFFLEITLTDEGVKEVNKVIERVFQAIANLKDKGVPQYLFDEVHRMATINYQYQSRENLFYYLMKNASWITDEDLATYPEQTLIVQKFDPEAVKELIDYLTPQRAHYFLNAPASMTRVLPDKQEKWLGAKYAIRQIPPEVIDQWSHSKPIRKIDLPPPNPFIPQQLVLTVSPENAPKEEPLIPHPDLIVNNESGKVYYAQDTRYRIPEAYIHFEIKTPQIEMGNPIKVVLADLYVKSVEEALSHFSYPASQAGLHYNISRKSYGLGIEVEGYSDNIDLLFDEILKQIKNVHPTEQEFNIYKESLRRDYQNFAKQSPLDQTIESLKNIIYKKFTTEKQKAGAILKVSYEKFNEYVASLFNQTYVEGMLYGNFNPNEAKDVTDKMLAAVKGVPLPKEKRKKPQVIILPSNEGPFYFETTSKMQGNAVILAIENPHQDMFDFKARAMQQILMQGMKESFFSELRTRQQTGYLVYSDSTEIERELFSIFAVQSNSHAVRDLLARFELFIEGYLQELSHEMTEDRFNLIRAALITSLEQPQKDVTQMGQMLNKLAFEYEGDFDWIAKRIKGFKDLTYSEFLNESHLLLGRENKQRIAVLMKGMIPPEKVFNYQPLKNLSILRRLAQYTAGE